MKALWFSGGKDSLACLFLHRDELNDIHVLWANTGKYLPEHVDFVNSFRSMCPHWHEVKTDRDAQNERFGLPTEILLIDHTVWGSQFVEARAPKVQSYHECCHANISKPLWEKTKALRCTAIIRGQRHEDEHRSPFEHGSRFDDVQFLHPIEDWTSERVMAFVAENVILPQHFALEHTSIDCFDCTAFLPSTEGRAAYLKEHHPGKHREFILRLKTLDAAVSKVASPMRRILEAA